MLFRTLPSTILPNFKTTRFFFLLPIFEPSLPGLLGAISIHGGFSSGESRTCFLRSEAEYSTNWPTAASGIRRRMTPPSQKIVFRHLIFLSLIFKVFNRKFNLMNSLLICYVKWNIVTERIRWIKKEKK